MNIFEKEYQKLNQEQKEAVSTTEGPVLVVAGPGSGKTQILALRVVNILQKHEDILPSNILCLTFTESGERNMRERLLKFIGNDAYSVNIFTFHKFGSEIINLYNESLGLYTELNPIEDIKKFEILYHLLKNLKYNDPLYFKDHDTDRKVNDILSVIAKLKEAGLTPQEFEMILNENKSVIEEVNKIINKGADISLRKKNGYLLWENIIIDLEKLSSKWTHSYFDSLNKFLVKSLKNVIQECSILEKSKPFSDWKSKHLEKDEYNYNKKVLKDTFNYNRYYSLANIYNLYQIKLNELGVIDFSDMILESIKILKDNPYFQAKVSEKYQYILVDEFQDTNDAQMQLIYFINQGKSNPNILAVGDDDQGIYKFQGAEISNIMSFTQNFDNTKIINLTKNYRSHQEILNIARTIILEGQERLETKLDNVNKNLKSEVSFSDFGIKKYEFDTQEYEYIWITNEISNLLEKGVLADEIAIISRNNKSLQNIIPYLIKKDIPIKYKKQQNLLQEKHILEIITILKYIHSLQLNQNARQDLLAEILSYSFWNIPRIELWKFFNKAKRSSSFLDLMLNSNNQQFINIATFLIELSLKSQANESAENIIYYIIGEKFLDNYISPYKNYYLNEQNILSEESKYISYLISIRSFVQKVVGYEPNQILNVKEFIKIVDLYEKQKDGILINSPFRTGKYSVSLYTAHSVKGLEFEYVFMLELNQNSWKSNNKSSNLIPINLPIGVKKDNEDDFLRLLFVAITRAKKYLYLTRHLYDINGKELEKVSTLNFIETSVVEKSPQILDILKEAFVLDIEDGISNEESRYLEGVLQDYKLSVSHLNSFLDINFKGPKYFLEYNLIHSPKVSNKNSSYGNALHDIFHKISLSIRSGKGFPSIDKIFVDFENRLKQDKLSFEDYKFCIDKAKDIIPNLIESKKDDFLRAHESEFSFENKNIVLDQVPIKGSIDRIELFDDKIVLVDFKTGKILKSWKDYKNQDKLNQYKRQLVFYAILVRESGLFGNNKNILGRIDFMDPDEISKQFYTLDLQITNEDINYLNRLIQIVYHKIQNLDFPDITKYQNISNGQVKFEQDLVEGII